MISKWIRTLIKGLSLASMFFIFEACYGTPQDVEEDVIIHGCVTYRNTSQPIEGIKVLIPQNNQYTYTNEYGIYEIYSQKADAYNLSFEDIDSTQNGSFQNLDTTIHSNDFDVTVNITLDSLLTQK